MGKRIPKSRRHKKTKFVDPFYTGHSRLPNKKNFTNEPPTASDYQEVSHQMEEFIGKKNAKFKRSKKKKILKDDFIAVKRDLLGVEELESNKNLPVVFKQRKTEKHHQFINRLQNMANVAIAEAKIETKYDIDLVHIDKDGNAEYVKPVKEASAKKKEVRRKNKEKQQQKKKIKREDIERDLKKEHIKFGEVVTAPPIFTAKPRKAPEKEKAGKKNLALNKILPSNQSENNNSIVAVKWKNMFPEKRKLLEVERQRAVELYRMAKNKKKR